MASDFPVILLNMRKIFRRLKRWRSMHAGRRPIPESLWPAAADLVREHEIYPTAKALHLEYGKLKQRAEAMGVVKRCRVKAPAVVPVGARPTAPPAFVELMAPRPGSFPGTVMELEGPRRQMRIELRGVTTAELATLSRALWDGEARLMTSNQ